jgi:hypothetical protein
MTASGRRTRLWQHSPGTADDHRCRLRRAQPHGTEGEGQRSIHLCRKYGEKLAFVGGFDVRVWEANDRNLIRREVASHIDGMKARGARLVFASDHSIPPTVIYDTYRYVLDVYRERMMYFV